MPPKRKAADAVTNSTKKVKAGGDIRNFFSSQGSSPPRRVTRTSSAAAASATKGDATTDKENAKHAIPTRKTATASCLTALSPKGNDGQPVEVVESVNATRAKMEAANVPALPTAPETASVSPAQPPSDTPAKTTISPLKEVLSVPIPLSKSALTSTPTFDVKAWASKLTDEQRELLGLEIATLDSSWFAVLKDELLSKDFLNLKRFLMSEHKSGKQIFPPAQDVYSWSRHAPLPTVKAVILGQDPYHNNNQAHGLCFSVRSPTPAPPSLKNIYKALEKEFPDFKPPPHKGGLLTPWADRGVLLLNACLTVRAHEANSHSNKGWERFTQAVIDKVAGGKRGVVFLAWGGPAGKRVAKVDKKKHLVLTGVHPSPLSAHRGFFDLGHFTRCNEWLVEKYGEEAAIDWSLDVDPDVAGV